MKKLNRQTRDEIARRMRRDDAEGLVSYLDYLKSNRALEYVLRILLSKRNTHTLESTIALLRKGREANPDA